MPMIVKNTGQILAEEIETADSFWSRFRGLMFKWSFEEGQALLFKFSKPRKFRIHTFFVFFSIDLVYLSKDFEVLEIKEKLSPWRLYKPSVEANYLLELPGGKVEKADLEEGDTLEFRKSESH
ncbi:hypothetical protein AKJ53_00205 [candidate division MSBL1 archaeon SCGC-AAA382F02]|uniref:DUF192 domain-containing protein n=1 Tax=candidate division MSBL1 archaeon SCGC-AAA382F02 TaxID=1698282 RepID=A0A133VJ30_9EURY|nr:hypothetical protein AKJ53_00205 [candidate division MSBL1 archaeon SCGC-AAA382F02]